MQQVFKIPECMKKDFRYTFCPGCDHGVAIRLLAEAQALPCGASTQSISRKLYKNTEQPTEVEEIVCSY